MIIVPIELYKKYMTIPIYCRTNTRIFFIKYSGPLTWNSTDVKIRLSKNIKVFKTLDTKSI